MPAQRGNSVPSSKISVLFLLSDVFKLLSHLLFSSSSFDLSLKSRFLFVKKAFDSGTHIQNKFKMQK